MVAASDDGTIELFKIPFLDRYWYLFFLTTAAIWNFM